VENNTQAGPQCLNIVPTIVTKDQNMFLLQNFLDIEMCRAIVDLPKHKVLGVDERTSKTFCKKHFKKEGYIRSLRSVYNHSSQSHGILLSSLITDQSQC
jgi:hypothetical protein